jgi:cell division septal protein FtsQ
MAQNNKPEWFEITDADEKPELRKVSKSLPVSAVMVAALILGAGVVVAQTQSETPTSAVAASSVESNPTTQAVSAVKAAVANPTTAAVAGVAATNKLANPSIAQLPAGRGDDDDDDRKRGHDDDEDDEDDEGDDD